MRFFRRRSSPALVALLAVAMQATLLFAHAHVHSHSADSHLGSKSTSIACRAMVPWEGCRPAVPQDRHDDCPLCWSLVASGAGVLPSSLSIESVPHARIRHHAVTSEPKVVAALPSPFEARGPPRG